MLSPHPRAPPRLQAHAALLRPALRRRRHVDSQAQRAGLPLLSQQVHRRRLAAADAQLIPLAWPCDVDGSQARPVEPAHRSAGAASGGSAAASWTANHCNAAIADEGEQGIVRAAAQHLLQAAPGRAAHQLIAGEALCSQLCSHGGGDQIKAAGGRNERGLWHS